MKRAIIGYGAFAREVAAQMELDDVKFFVDDGHWNSESKNLFKLSQFYSNEYEVIIAIANPSVRSNIVDRLSISTEYFAAIHKSVHIYDKTTFIDKGSIICAGTIISINCKIGRHSHINQLSSVGHDCVFGDFFTTAPGVNISGNNIFGNRVYIGTGSSTREKITICDDVTIGMQSGVIKNITEPGTYIGSPTRKL